MLVETLNIRGIQEAYRKKDCSPVEITRAYLNRIEEIDNMSKAYITVRDREALKEAKKLNLYPAGYDNLMGLAGIPIAIKDNICTRGTRTTAGSKFLEDFIPSYDASLVKRIREAGGIILGKSNMDEFAGGFSGDRSPFAPSLNPWTKEPADGGAVAVASGLAPLAIGTDTGGSVRLAATYCGVVGLKASYALVSRYGVIGLSSSLDHVGIYAKTVKDSGLILQIIGGRDKRDPTSYGLEVTRDYLSKMAEKIRGIKMGLARELFADNVDPQILQKVNRAIKILEGRGAIIEEFSLPILSDSLWIYSIISSAEASSNLSRFDGIRYGHRSEDYEDIDQLISKSRTEGLGWGIKGRIILGSYVLSTDNYDSYYQRALDMRRQMQAQFDQIFKKYDFILGPSSPSLSPDLERDNLLQIYREKSHTAWTNLIGGPAISIPCGLSKEKLPIGLQLVGSHFSEAKLLGLAHHLEEELQVDTKIPELKGDNNGF